MLDLTDEQKAAAEAKKVEEEKKKQQEEEDPFADIFNTPDTEETSTDETSEDTEEEKKKKEEEQKKIKQTTQNVDTIVNKKVSDAVAQIDRRANVNDFLSSDRGRLFAPYAEQIRKVASDLRFAAIPVSQLPQLILKPEVYTKVLTDAKAKADEEAADTVMGGSNAKNLTPEELRTIDPLSMSREEFNALKNRAKRGEFKIKK